MKLAELHIHNVRNIQNTRLQLNSRINLITGSNGSGKTSFLEALYLLSSARSFRTREITALVSHGQEKLTVYAKTDDMQTISIQKSLHQPTLARINNYPCLSSSELAAFLPCQLFYQDIFQIIDAGPLHRRGLLDWGLFHVEHDYLSLWKNYKRALKQRNALLKQRANPQHLLPWNTIMADCAQQLHELRAMYFQRLNEVFTEVLASLTSVNCVLEYYKGWDRKAEGKTLDSILRDSYERDLLRQFTHYGAHQADLLVESKDHKVKNYLSRGQQKMILFALKLTQSRLLDKPCIFLMDDMTSELDNEHSERLFNYLHNSEGQFFLSAQPGDYLQTLISNTDACIFTLREGEVLS